MSSGWLLLWSTTRTLAGREWGVCMSKMISDEGLRASASSRSSSEELPGEGGDVGGGGGECVCGSGIYVGGDDCVYVHGMYV